MYNKRCRQALKLKPPPENAAYSLTMVKANFQDQYRLISTLSQAKKDREGFILSFIDDSAPHTIVAISEKDAGGKKGKRRKSAKVNPEEVDKSADIKKDSGCKMNCFICDSLEHIVKDCSWRDTVSDMVAKMQKKQQLDLRKQRQHALAAAISTTINHVGDKLDLLPLPVRPMAKEDDVPPSLRYVEAMLLETTVMVASTENKEAIFESDASISFTHNHMGLQIKSFPEVQVTFNGTVKLNKGIKHPTWIISPQQHFKTFGIQYA